MQMSSKRFEVSTKCLVAPGGCRYDVTGWVAGRGIWISIRRGLGIAGVKIGRVYATSSGDIDWSTMDTHIEQ